MNVSKLSIKLKEKIKQFSGELSKGLCKVSQRFVSEMLYGIQKRRKKQRNKISPGVWISKGEIAGARRTIVFAGSERFWTKAAYDFNERAAT